MKRFIFPVLALAAAAALIFNLASPILAGDARLYLAPSSGTFYVGTSFSVAVRVNSGSHQTNAYKAIVKFPTNLLTATSASVGGSICSLQITGSPSYSNSTGTANFECGHPGYFSGTAGLIGTITFSVRGTGTANLSFTTAQIKAADGSGTEVLGSTGGAAYNLQPAPVSSPVVSSTTHSNQNTWYPNRSVNLNWTAPSGSNGFSYTFDGRRTTIPDDVSEGTATSGSFTAQSDGIYYFHIKARGAGGWGSTAHFRIQADTAPPDPFEIFSDPPADNVTFAPLIWAAATDRTSGIDHYEISLDGGDFATVTLPHQFISIPEGNHSITIKAVDRAGNYRDSSLIIKVVDIEDPVITRPPDGSFLPLLESLIIEGTSPVGTVELHLNDTLIATVESDGTFSYTHHEFLRPGEYRITAVAINENGIESSPVSSTFRVDPRAVTIFGFTFPGWLVYSTLLGMVALLIFLLILYRRRQRRFDEHVVEDVEEIEEKVEKTLDKAEEDLDRAVEEVLESGDPTKIHEMEHELERRIKETEGQVRKELEEKLEKIKGHHQGVKKRTILPEIWDRIILFWKKRRKKKKAKKKR